MGSILRERKREREGGGGCGFGGILFLRTRLKLRKDYLESIVWAMIERFISHSKRERFLGGF